MSGGAFLLMCSQGNCQSEYGNLVVLVIVLVPLFLGLGILLKPFFDQLFKRGVSK